MQYDPGCRIPDFGYEEDTEVRETGRSLHRAGKTGIKRFRQASGKWLSVEWSKRGRSENLLQRIGAAPSSLNRPLLRKHQNETNAGLATAGAFILRRNRTHHGRHASSTRCKPLAQRPYWPKRCVPESQSMMWEGP